MLGTDYFYNKVMIKRPYLKLEWIERVLENPVKEENQAEDGRIRYWGYIDEIGKYLRVITLDDGITVHNAFPDMDFNE
ncbi:MAG: hypothetical protein HW421_1018 [Ignavibacteria bacterium]|nr:hypothetical protein [Ignavibacteria bacterium]